jgi:hypothetical protein
MNTAPTFSRLIDRFAKPAPRQTSRRTPKLLAQVRYALRSRHYSKRTEDSYVVWIKRYIFFHNVRHPAEMAGNQLCLTKVAWVDSCAR